MNPRDVVRGALHGAAENRVEHVERASTRFARHLQLVQINAIELARERPESDVAVTPDSRQNRRDTIPYEGIGAEAALEENCSRARVEIRNRAAYCEQCVTCGRGNGHRCTHGMTLSMRVTRMPSPPSALRSAIVR